MIDDWCYIPLSEPPYSMFASAEPTPAQSVIKRWNYGNRGKSQKSSKYIYERDYFSLLDFKGTPHPLSFPSNLNCKEMNNKRGPLVRSPIPSPLLLKMLGYLCLRKCFRIKSSPKFWFNLDSRLPWLRFFCRSIFLKMPVIHLLWAAYFVSTVSTEKEAFSANQLSANSLTEKSWLFVSLF